MMRNHNSTVCGKDLVCFILFALQPHYAPKTHYFYGEDRFFLFIYLFIFWSSPDFGPKTHQCYGEDLFLWSSPISRPKKGDTTKSHPDATILSNAAANY